MTTARRIALTGGLSVLGAAVTTVLLATGAWAHGSATDPGSRTYLCYQDGHWTGGDLEPRNPACGQAVLDGGTQPLWDWFGVLNSAAGGQTTGYIPDGQLCSGGNPKYSAFNAARTDWPTTHLTSGGNYTLHFNAWAPHPGTFYVYSTRDGYDPTQPLAWSDLDQPFSSWSESTPNGTGEYYWTVKLPTKSGRHILFVRWVRSDSAENFFSCSDVVYDGGNGEITGIPTSGPATSAPLTPAASSTTTTSAGSATTTTRTAPASTTSSTTTRAATTTGTTPTSTTATRPVTSSTATSSSTPPVTTSAATGPCSVRYVTNQWAGGFTADVTLTNTGPATSGWRLTWTFPGDQKVTSAWNATVTQSGTAATASNAAWNAALATGGTANFGFQGTWATSDATPTDFALNGVSCSGTPTTTTPPPTTTTRTSSTTRTTTVSGPPTITLSTTTRSTSATTSTTTRPSTTTAGTTTTTGGSGTATLSDGFESQAAGAPSGGWSVVTKDCSGTGTATVDTTVAHSGTHSLRVDGGSGYCNHVFVRAPIDPSTVGSSFYVRLYLRHTTALPASHVTFLAMNDAADGNNDLRIGGQNSALQWNRQSDDATLPAQSPAGIALSQPLPTTGWQCLEYRVDTAGTAATWLNGSQVTGLTVDGTPTADVDQQWLARSWQPRLTDLRLGWESYGGGTDTLWFDDVAVGPNRIGC